MFRRLIQTVTSVPKRGRLAVANATNTVRSAAVQLIPTLLAIIRFLAWCVVAFSILLMTVVVTLLILASCLGAGAVTAVAVRSALLQGVPRNHRVPVDLNLAALHTEPWRWHEMSNLMEAELQRLKTLTAERAIQRHQLQHVIDTKRLALGARDKASHSPSASNSGGSSFLPSWLRSAQPKEEERPAPAECEEACTRLTDGSCSKAIPPQGGRGGDHHDSAGAERGGTLMNLPNAPAPTGLHEDDASWLSLMEAQEAHHSMETLRTFKTQQWKSLLATGTLRIAPLREGDAFTGASSKEGGGGGVEDGWEDEEMFTPPPKSVFNAMGIYRAELQLVIAREASSRLVPITVDLAMLATPKHYDAAALLPLGGLKTLFARHQSTTLRTAPPESSWVVSAVVWSCEIVFVIPLSLWRVGVFFVRESWRSSATLLRWVPVIGESLLGDVEEGSHELDGLMLNDDEIAVSLPLYDRFRPSKDVQRRIKALNVTIYQGEVPSDGANHGLLTTALTAVAGRGSPSKEDLQAAAHVRILKGFVVFRVELEGLPYWLLTFPILSTSILTVVFATTYLAGVASVTIGLVAICAYIGLVVMQQ